jgi:hypothetical protein
MVVALRIHWPYIQTETETGHVCSVLMIIVPDYGQSIAALATQLHTVTLMGRFQINSLTTRNRNMTPTVIISINGRLLSIITFLGLIMQLTDTLSSSNVRSLTLVSVLPPKIFTYRERNISYTSSEWQRDCCWPSPAHSLSGPNPAGLMTTFYCLRFETYPTLRARSPYLYPRGTGRLGYIPRRWVPLSSPPTPRRVTVEVFGPASTRVWTVSSKSKSKSKSKSHCDWRLVSQ